MATRRKGVVSWSRIITTRSTKAKELPEATSTVTKVTASPVRETSTSGFVDAEDDGCCWSTPKAKRYRIPEIESCPPAPKKQRASGDGEDGDGGKCLLRRSSIPFFKPPHELAEFFSSVSPFQMCPQFEA